MSWSTPGLSNRFILKLPEAVHSHTQVNLPRRAEQRRAARPGTTGLGAAVQTGGDPQRLVRDRSEQSCHRVAHSHLGTGPELAAA